MATNGHLAKFTAHAGQRDALVEALRPMFEAVKAEPGTLLYMMHVCPSDPDTVWFYERYLDDAAFEVHRTTAAHDAALLAIRPLLAVPPEVHQLELVGCKANSVLTPGITGLI